MTTPNILVVEDQTPTLDSISYAIRKVIFGEEKALPRFGDYTSKDVEQELRKNGIDFARGYNDAQDFISNQSKKYRLVFLDHRMPYENCVELEKKDSRAFGDRMHEIGYSLIPEIRKYHPNSIIVLMKKDLKTYILTVRLQNFLKVKKVTLKKNLRKRKLEK